MPSIKELASVAAIAAVTVALIFRVDAAREMLTGIKASAADKGNPSAPRTLYI